MSKDIQFRKKLLTCAASLLLSSYGITLSIIGSAVSSIRSDLKITPGTVGLLFAFSPVRCIYDMCLFGGYFIDRLGIKLATLISEIILGLGVFPLSPPTFSYLQEQL